MKKIFLTIAAAAAMCLAFPPARAQDLSLRPHKSDMTGTYEPSEEILKAREDFRSSRLGIFLHWGIYSMLGRGEWVMNTQNINYMEYSHLADGFCPSKFNAEEWVKAFKEAGAGYITFTSRHHDGFSMFKTEASPYNVVDATPFGRDVLGELAEACHKEGLSLHVYYSHLDWFRTDYPLGREGLHVGRPTDRQNWDSYFAFMNRQLTEILTNYGPVGAIWFDGWWDHDMDPKPFDWHLPEQYALIHRLQPSCMIGNNHHGDPFPGEDFQIYEQDLPGENTHGLSGQAASDLPLEACITMNDSWGYNITDKNYKSSDDLIRELVKAAGKDCNLLLNIGPRPDGCLPDEALERLRAIGEFMKIYAPTINGTRGGFVAPHSWGVTTQKGNTLYVHILDLDDDALFLPTGGRKVAGAKVYATGEKVGVKASGEGVVLSFPQAPHGVDYVVELTLKD